MPWPIHADAAAFGSLTGKRVRLLELEARSNVS